MALHGSSANPWPTNMDKTNVLGTERNILEQRGRGGYVMKTVRSAVGSSALKPNSFCKATDTVTAGVFSHCQKAVTGLGQGALLPGHCHQEARKRCLQRRRAASLSVMGQGMLGTETPGGMQANTCRGSESGARWPPGHSCPQAGHVPGSHLLLCACWGVGHMNGVVVDSVTHEIYQWSWLFNRSDASIRQMPFECNLPGSQARCWAFPGE